MIIYKRGSHQNKRINKIYMQIFGNDAEIIAINKTEYDSLKNSRLL